VISPNKRRPTGRRQGHRQVATHLESLHLYLPKAIFAAVSQKKHSVTWSCFSVVSGASPPPLDVNVFLPSSMPWSDMPELTTLIGLNLVFLIAGTIATLSGFGFALIAVPFAVALLPPAEAIPCVLVAWMPLAVLLACRYRRHMSLRRLIWLFAGAAVGMTVGVQLLATVPSDIMRGAIGYVTLGLCAMLLVKPGRPLKHERAWQPLVGLLSGTLGGSCGIPGPPVVLFGLKQEWEWQSLRADLVGYFLILNTYQTLLCSGYSLLNSQTLGMGLTSLPGVLGGYFLGIRLSPHVSQQRFRRLAFTIVVAGALTAILRAL